MKSTGMSTHEALPRGPAAASLSAGAVSAQRLAAAWADSPRAVAQRRSIEGVADSPRVVGQRQRLLSTMGGAAAGVVQRAPLGGPPHNYVALNSSARFIRNHLAGDEAGARQASTWRAEDDRGITTNTVIADSDAVVQALVHAADFRATWRLYGKVYAVPIVCNHRVVHLAAGGNGNNLVREVGALQNGAVTLKVFFNKNPRQFSVTGVRG